MFFRAEVVLRLVIVVVVAGGGVTTPVIEGGEGAEALGVAEITVITVAGELALGPLQLLKERKPHFDWFTLDLFAFMSCLLSSLYS
jgi:hypothetical protein